MNDLDGQKKEGKKETPEFIAYYRSCAGAMPPLLNDPLHAEDVKSLFHFRLFQMVPTLYAENSERQPRVPTRHANHALQGRQTMHSHTFLFPNVEEVSFAANCTPSPSSPNRVPLWKLWQHAKLSTAWQGSTGSKCFFISS